MPLNYTLCHKFQLILLPCTAACISPSIGSKRRNQESEKRAEGYFVVSQLGGGEGQEWLFAFRSHPPILKGTPGPEDFSGEGSPEVTHTLLIGPPIPCS